MQTDGERRTFAGLGVQMNRAVRFFDEPLDDRQSEAGAFVGGFGREFFLEHFADILRADARPIVLNGDGDNGSMI